MVPLSDAFYGMLVLPVSARTMGQCARKNLYLVHPVHVVLSQSSGSGTSYGEWNSKMRCKFNQYRASNTQSKINA